MQDFYEALLAQEELETQDWKFKLTEAELEDFSHLENSAPGWEGWA